MPNWCWNVLTVGGPRAMREEFRSRTRGGEFELSFDALVPIPAELRDEANPPDDRLIVEERNRKYGASNWPDWVSGNWGTKWDVASSYPEPPAVEEVDHNLQYTFYTAWAPPEDWLRKVASMFPALSFVLHYHESNNQFEGEITAHGNEYEDKELPFLLLDWEVDDDDGDDS